MLFQAKTPTECGLQDPLRIQIETVDRTDLAYPGDDMVLPISAK